MGTTPNYIQIERILINQQQYASQKPTSAGGSLKADVEQALTDFRDAVDLTDREYLAWRSTFNGVLKAHKGLRAQYDGARNECLEWGVDGFPDAFVSYMDEEKTQENGEAMVVFLKDVDLNQEWVAARTQSLQQALNEARSAQQMQEIALRKYRGLVPTRTTGYKNALRVAREFFAAVKGELEFGTTDYNNLTPHAV